MAIDRTRSGSEISNGRQLHLLRARIQILCVWCFDFMELDGENWPPLSLVARKQKRGRAPTMERSSLPPPFRAFQHAHRRGHRWTRYCACPHHPCSMGPSPRPPSDTNQYLTSPRKYLLDRLPQIVVS